MPQGNHDIAKSGSIPAHGPRIPASTLAAIVKDAADRFEREPQRYTGGGDVKLISESLRTLADALIETTGPHFPEAVAKIAGICASFDSGHDSFAIEPDHPHTATHAAPLAPGGLGYVMSLSEEEEEKIEWGSNSVS